MKLFVEKELTYTQKVFTAIKCDWCGVEVPLDSLPDTMKDHHRCHIHNTVTNETNTEGTEVGWAVDLCSTCSEELKALLVQVGITPYEVNVSWGNDDLQNV